MTETRDWLKKLETHHLTNDTFPSLYIHECYNVRTYQDNTAQGNFIQKIRNDIANTVMRKVLLPSAIIILISNNILDDPVFAVECSEGLLQWLLDEVFEIIKFHKKCLPPKSTKFEEPRVYVVKALPKPSKIPLPTLFRGVRRKYNNNLQNLLENYHNFGFINVHEITTQQQDEKFFISNYSGKLSDEGIIQFWISISQTFKAMDDKVKAAVMVLNKNTQTEILNFRDNPEFNAPRQRRSQTPQNRFSRGNSDRYHNQRSNSSRRHNWTR